MKKLLSILLVVTMLLSVSAFAFALEDDDVGNVTNFGSYSGDITYKSSSDAGTSITYSGNDKTLTDEQKKAFIAGHEDLVDTFPDVGEIQYYVYTESGKYPVDLEFTVTNTNLIKAAIFDGEKYILLKVTKTDRNTVIVTIPCEGSLYLYESTTYTPPVLAELEEEEPEPIPSVVAPVQSGEKTSHKPLVDCDIRITPLIDEKKLQPYQLDIFNAGYKDLKNVVPDDALVQYYVYVESDLYPVDADFRISNINSISAKFYTGTWQELKVTDNMDGTVSIMVPSEGALAIFNDKTEQITLTGFENKDALNAAARASFEAAYADLKEICPKGMENKFFAYCESNSFPVSYDFELGNVAEYTAMYNIKGKWVELDGNDNKDGTVRISVPCEGCLAIFMK